MNRLLRTMIFLVLGMLAGVSPVLAHSYGMVGHVAGHAGDVVRVPITLNSREAARAVLTIGYDPVFLTPVEQPDTPSRFHLAGSDTDGETITSTATTGTVHVQIENPGGLLGQGELVVLPFTLNINTASGSVTPLTVNVTFSDAAGNSVASGILANGSVTAQDATMVAIRALLLGKAHVPAVSADGTPRAWPESIVPGGTAVLSWGFLYADTVTIDHGIGIVASSGMIVVSPTETTTYHITATNPSGSITLEVTIVVDQDNPLTIQISSPAADASLTRPDSMVQGSITNTGTAETGITVNGRVALQDTSGFIANHVLLHPGDNIITATVSDTAGHSTATSVIVHVNPNDNYIELSSDSELGIAPLEFTLNVDATFTLPASGATLSHNGSGTVEILSSSPDTFKVRLTTPGIYYFTATVIEDGTTYTDVVAVQVLDTQVFDSMLQEVWTTMKSALINGDFQTAVLQFTHGSRAIFEQLFAALQGNASQMAQAMQPIELVYQKNATAEYRISRDIQFNGQAETVVFYIYFDREGDGIWRIRDF